MLFLYKLQRDQAGGVLKESSNVVLNLMLHRPTTRAITGMIDLVVFPGSDSLDQDFHFVLNSLSLFAPFFFSLSVYVDRIFVATWNVAGKSPPNHLSLDDWLPSSTPADVYVLGCVLLLRIGIFFSDLKIV